MKKSFIFSIVWVLLLSASQVSALTYKDADFSEENITNISESSISEAKLLQDYVLRYQTKINTLYAEYSNEASQTLKDANTILDKMSWALTKIQDKYLDESEAESVMKSIVYDLKILNERMKVYLDQEKTLYQNNLAKKKKQFSQAWKKISSILDSLIENISSLLIKKENLSEKEKNIVESLVKIRFENNKIKEFDSIVFWSEEEMNQYFKNIIQNVRNEILIIKELSR